MFKISDVKDTVPSIIYCKEGATDQCWPERRHHRFICFSVFVKDSHAWSANDACCKFASRLKIIITSLLFLAIVNTYCVLLFHWSLHLLLCPACHRQKIINTILKPLTTSAITLSCVRWHFYFGKFHFFSFGLLDRVYQAEYLCANRISITFVVCEISAVKVAVHCIIACTKGLKTWKLHLLEPGLCWHCFSITPPWASHSLVHTRDTSPCQYIC